MSYASLGNIQAVVSALKTDATRLAAVGTPESPIKRAWLAEPGVFGGKFPAQVIAGYSGRGQKQTIMSGYIPQDIALTMRWYTLGVGAQAPQKLGWEQAEADSLAAFSFFMESLEADPGFRGEVRDYNVDGFEAGATDRMGNPFVEQASQGSVNYLWRVQSILRVAL